MAISTNMIINVPLEIRLTGYDNEPFAHAGGFSFITASIGIINEHGQMLVKLDSGESYSVFSGGIFPNENNGANYCLAKRKRLKAGKLYFATEYEEGSPRFQEQLKGIENYVLFTDKDTYVFWKPLKVVLPSEKTLFEIHHIRAGSLNNLKHFYEVKKRRERKARLRH